MSTTMSITRIINGFEEPIELTLDELAEASEVYAHHLLCETVKGNLNSGCYEEFENLGDDVWECAVSNIAERAAEIMEECGDMCESDAVDYAIREYIKEHGLTCSEDEECEENEEEY